MNFERLIQKNSQEKGIIAWINPTLRILDWEVHSGSIYKKVLPFYLVELEYKGEKQNQVFSLVDVIGDGLYYYDYSSRTVYFQAALGENPSNQFTVASFNIAFSEFPYIAPPSDNPLEVKNEIEYLPLINKVNDFKHELDHVDQIGISFTTKSQISFFYDDFFQEYYDTLSWENKRVRIFLYSREIPFSEKKLLFDGFIEDKSFSESSVSFSIQDFLGVLNDKVRLNNVSSSDGDVSDNFIGKAKRRVYGRVAGLRTVSFNQVLSGFLGQGTITANLGATTINGSGTQFISEVCPEDKLIVEGEEYKVEEVISDTQILLSDELKLPAIAAEYRIDPEVQSIRTGRNTNQLIAGHPLKLLSTTITAIVQANRFELASTESLMVGDVITIDGQIRTIRRISENLVTINQSLPSSPSIGASVIRNPVQGVFANGLSFLAGRDYSFQEISGESFVQFDELAEFNVVTGQRLPGSATITSGSKIISFSDIEIKARFKARDWLKPASNQISQWLEIDSIDDEAGTVKVKQVPSFSFSGQLLHKSISPIGDRTIVTVECFGKTVDNTNSGEAIVTASQAVEDLVLDLGIPYPLNQASFDFSHEAAPHLLSLKLPLNYNSESPTYRDAISTINKSVFGSLHYNQNFEVEYNVLTSEKPTELPNEELSDSDAIKWSIKSTSKNILLAANGRYRHFDADRFSGEQGSKVHRHESLYAKFVVKTTKEDSFDFYLWDTVSGETMTERKVLFSESPQSIISIDGSISLALKAINDRLFIRLERLYKRFGNTEAQGNLKIALISSISKSASGVRIVADDLGNIWNKVANITLDYADDFDVAPDDQKPLNGYITENDDLIDGRQETYRINLIG